MQYKIEIEQDPTDPRDSGFANLAQFAFKHRRLDLGDKAYSHLDCTTLEQLYDVLQKEYHAAVIEKVSATDHSSFHIYMGNPQDPWDSGVLGFAFITREVLDREFSGDTAMAVKAIEQELSEYDAYLNGEVYCVQILDDAGECVEQCGGFYTEDAAREWAEEFLDQPL